MSQCILLSFFCRKTLSSLTFYVLRYELSPFGMPASIYSIIAVHFCGVYPVALLILILPKYVPAIAIDNLHFISFYFVCSLHVSAPTGHPQVKHNNIIYIFMKTIILQHIRYFTIIHLYGVLLLLSIYLLYNHTMVIV
jgi:hypothetical protein